MPECGLVDAVKNQYIAIKKLKEKGYEDKIIMATHLLDSMIKVNKAKYTEVEISMRYFNPNARKTVHEALKRHAKAIADAYEISSEVIIEEGTISLFNDKDLVKIADKAATKVLGEGRNIPMQRVMASEDMSYYLKHAKGVYVNIGYRNEEKECVYFPHHEKFKIDEDYLKYGASLFIQFALDFLNNNQ